MLFSLPGSLDRLILLRQVAATLRQAGLEILAVPVNPTPGLGQQPAVRALTVPVVDQGATEIATSYRLFAGRGASSVTASASGPPRHVEVLIDPRGAVRARWMPDGEPDGWANPARVQAEALRLREEQAERSPAGEHVH